MCPAELSSPKLHSLLNNPKLRMLTHGMKGVGSQGDGSIQLLCKGKDEQLEVCCIYVNGFCPKYILQLLWQYCACVYYRFCKS